MVHWHFGPSYDFNKDLNLPITIPGVESKSESEQLISRTSLLLYYSKFGV